MSRVQKKKKYKDPAQIRARILNSDKQKEEEAPPKDLGSNSSRSFKNLMKLTNYAEKRNAQVKHDKRERMTHSERDQRPGSGGKDSHMFEAIKPGESFKQFNSRLAQQTREALLEDSKKNNRKAIKQKEFWETKKRKREEVEEEEYRDFDDLKDVVKFGEQADRPPTLRFAPKIKRQKVIETTVVAEPTAEGAESEPGDRPATPADQPATHPKTITIMQRGVPDKTGLDVLKQRMLAQFYKKNRPSVSARLSLGTTLSQKQIPDIAKKKIK